MNDATLLAMPEAKFTKLVLEAFTLYRNGDLLELATSPLACSSLVEPYFLENEPRTTDALHRAMQSILSWVVDQLRPDGSLDWTAATWRNYNILHHYYLKGMLLSELAEQMYTSEQNISRNWRPVAIAATAHILQDELQDSRYAQQIKNITIAERYTRFAPDEVRRFILRFVSIFRHPIPSQILYQQDTPFTEGAIQSGLSQLALDELLLIDAPGVNLSVQPELRSYLHLLLSPTEQQAWHNTAGEYYLDQHDYLEATRHFRWAGEFQTAALTLVEHNRYIIDNLEIEPLRDILTEFKRAEITDPNLWARLKIVSGQIAESLENIDEALLEYREALSAPDILTKALAYYRRAKAFRFKNLDEALAHYKHGIKILEEYQPQARVLVKLYTDRAWIFMQERQDLAQAERDLSRAQTLIERDDWANWADLHNAWGDYHYWQGDNAQALEQRLQAWRAANEVQDVDRMIRTSNNVGQDYTALGQYDQALEYLELSTNLANQAGDQVYEALGLKAIGACYFWQEEYMQAIHYYKMARNIFVEIKNRTWLASTYYDLAEAYTKINDIQTAKTLIKDSQEIAQEIRDEVLLQDINQLLLTHPQLGLHNQQLQDRQEQVLQYVNEQGSITNKIYRELTGISQKQATRDLNELVELGLLTIEGKGRSTRYITPQRSA